MHASYNTAIKVERLSKQYLIGRGRRANESFREAVTRAFTAPIPSFGAEDHLRPQKKKRFGL